MCCVMPPLSPLTTLMPMIRSSSDVLPWSTWPRNVMTGGRGSRLLGVVFGCRIAGRAVLPASGGCLMSMSRPSSAASSSTNSSGIWPLMLAGILFVISTLSTEPEPTPVCSQNSRTLQGRTSSTFSLRGAVGPPCRLCADERASAAPRETVVIFARGQQLRPAALLLTLGADGADVSQAAFAFHAAALAASTLAGGIGGNGSGARAELAGLALGVGLFGGPLERSSIAGAGAFEGLGRNAHHRLLQPGARWPWRSARAA